MSLIKLVHSDASKPIKLVMSAGFSTDAKAHLDATVKMSLAKLEKFDTQEHKNVDIISVRYEPDAGKHQKDAVERKDLPREYDLYKSLGNMIGEELKAQGIFAVHVIAKSAGAAVLTYLPLYIKIESIALIAPAPIVIDSFGIPCRSNMPLYLGWNYRDPKIPYTYYEKVRGFLSAHGYTVEGQLFDKDNHDFTEEFIDGGLLRMRLGAK